VLNRKLKSVHFLVIQFYHAILGLIFAITFLLLEHYMLGIDWRVHPMHVMAGLLLACVLDFICMNTQTIAFQKDSSGFVSIIGYIGVLYAFLADTFIFHDSISTVEMASAFVILLVTMSVTVFKLRENQLAKKGKI